MCKEIGRTITHSKFRYPKNFWDHFKWEFYMLLVDKIPSRFLFTPKINWFEFEYETENIYVVRKEEEKEIDRSNPS